MIASGLSQWTIIRSTQKEIAWPPLILLHCPDSVELTRSAHVAKSAYRIKTSITAVIRRGASERFKCLDGGSVLFLISGPDSAGMIEARYDNDSVFVFERDLDEASEQIEVEMAVASPS
jgi:hypothetical protein